MRQLQVQEVQQVSGAGVLTSTLTTAVQAGSALGSGLVSLGTSAYQAGTILAQPLVSTTTAVLKFLI